MHQPIDYDPPTVGRWVDVWRVEHRWRRIKAAPRVYEGPFTMVYSPSALHATNMPSPHFDGIEDPYPSPTWVTGLPSWNAYLRWFAPDADILRDFNIVVRRYRIPEWAVKHGRHQVTFDSQFAHLVETKEVLEDDSQSARTAA